jgi:hypothetical protein
LSKEPGTWGRTKTDFQHVHFFEDNRKICPGKHRNQHGWLFYGLPNWTPDMPGTCSNCLQMLIDEGKLKEPVGKKKKVKV